MAAEDARAACIYKVLGHEELAWAAKSGIFTGSSVDRADGFIHFSTGPQLAETLKRHYAGRADLVVLAVPTAALGAALNWEPSRGGDLFPHLYKSLDLALVTAQAPISVGDDGSCELPGIVR